MNQFHQAESVETYAAMDTSKRIRVVMTSLPGHESWASVKNKRRERNTDGGNRELTKQRIGITARFQSEDDVIPK